jgi:hypothetical protein
MTQSGSSAKADSARRRSSRDNELYAPYSDAEIKPAQRVDSTNLNRPKLRLLKHGPRRERGARFARESLLYELGRLGLVSR